MNYRKIILYNAPLILWGAFVMYALLMSGDKIPSFRFHFVVPFDKIVHFGLFFILQLCAFYALFKQSRLMMVKSLGIAFIAVVLYGIFTEFLQHVLTSNRSAEVSDVLANASGAFIAAILIYLVSLKFYISKS